MKKQLKFNDNGKFRILLFGDLHEKDDVTSPEGKAKFEDMQLLMKTAIAQLKPDLAVFMGDLINDCKDLDTSLDRIVKPLQQAGIPFAAVLGNHEHDRGANATAQALISHPNSLCYNDDENITGDLNYNLTIQARNSDKTAFNLWFIDSNNLCPDKSISTYDWVHKDQIEWYERKAQELKEQNGGKTVPAVLFQHIPVTEEYQALRQAKPWELYPSVKGHAKRKNKRFVGNEKVIAGYVGEDPCAPQVNDGQFESWKKTGDVIGAFFGHDHLNDFTCVVDSITMGQCKTAGFRCYTDGCRSCVRTVDLDENDLTKLVTTVIHFKEFGLKCKSLGPIKRTINDKQSFVLTVASRLAITAAVTGAIITVAEKIKAYNKQ